MNKTPSSTIDKSIPTKRFIGHIKGAHEGPTLIFIAGIHGNEPSGVYALRKVLHGLEGEKNKFRGNLYAINGNLPALKKGIRYLKHDLNRLWTADTIAQIRNDKIDDRAQESAQLTEIYQSIEKIIATEKGPFYFFDLHTTSSKTIPFITLNDSLLNRKYTSHYPVPLILGIEEFLEGALLSYINEKGYVAFGFEGGQHDDPSSIHNHIAFIMLSLVFSGCMDEASIDFRKYYHHLSHKVANSRQFYEIVTRYEIKPFEEFDMFDGFTNFQRIKKGDRLATSNGRPIFSEGNGLIFMPLYQGKGNDGYFIIQKTPILFLKISTVLRKIRFDKILPLLPGVRWSSTEQDELIVNLKVARFFTRKFLHLLGYRNKRIDKTHLKVKNREAASKASEYEGYIM